MILFTGSGSLAKEYQKQFPCKIISARKMTDNELSEQILKCSGIINNAANIKCSLFDEAINDNFLLTKRIIDLVHKVSPGLSFIHISSMSMLQTDKIYKPIEEMTLYAFSKYLAEIYCLKHDHHPVTTVRFSTLFYENPEKDGLSKLVSDAVHKKEVTLYDNGEAKRDFIPVKIAAQYLHKLISAESNCKKINIASGKAVSFKAIADQLGLHIPGLKINNITSASPAEVLHTFSREGIEIAGEIYFSLGEMIKEYADKLS